MKLIIQYINISLFFLKNGKDMFTSSVMVLNFNFEPKDFFFLIWPDHKFIFTIKKSDLGHGNCVRLFNSSIFVLNFFRCVYFWTDPQWLATYEKLYDAFDLLSLTGFLHPGKFIRLVSADTQPQVLVSEMKKEDRCIPKTDLMC